MSASASASASSSSSSTVDAGWLGVEAAREQQRQRIAAARASLEESATIGAATLGALAEHGETLRRIDRTLDSVDIELTHAERVERSFSFSGRMRNFCEFGDFFFFECEIWLSSIFKKIRN